MVKATDFANRNDSAEFRPLNWPAVGRILVEREVSTRPVVVREVASQGAAQVPFAKDQHVIQTLAPDGADEPLREGVLPQAVRRREDFTDAHALHPLPEHVTVDRVAIADEVVRGGVVREGVHDLLGRPGSGGMLGDIEVDDAPAWALAYVRALAAPGFFSTRAWLPTARHRSERCRGASLLLGA